MSSLVDEVAKVPLTLHSDALFDSCYTTTELEVGPYRGLGTQLKAETVGANAIEWSNANGRFRVEVCAPWLLRIRCAPRAGQKFGPSLTETLGLVQVPAQATKWSHRLGGKTDSLRTEALALELDNASLDWTVRDANGTALVECLGGGTRFSPVPGEYSGDAFLAAFRLGQEDLFGMGGRIANPNQRGATADMFAMTVGLCQGDYGGFPIPYFISTKGYGVFLNNPWPHVYFDLGKTRADQWWVHGPGGEFDLFVIAGPAFAQVVSRFTELVGRIPTPQRWWLGFWASASVFSSTREMENVAHRLRLENYPCDALVIGGPWRGGPGFLAKYMQDGEYPTNDLNWHPDFGDGAAMVKRLAELGFKTVLHQNSRSWLVKTTEQGVKDGTLRTVGREVVVRLTYPEGEKFYADALRPRHQEGIGCWWLDHGDRVSGEIRPGAPSRNLFGALWARATQKAAAADGIGQQLALIRGAGIGGQAASLPWPGDTKFGIDYFEEDMWFCLNAGLSGFPITSADLGGFMSQKEPIGHNTAYDIDNLSRRLCQGIFLLPNPRMHQSDSHPAKLPWNCPTAIQRLYRAMLEERYRLAPYFYSYAVHASRTGEPILRHLVYHHTQDPVAVQTHDQCYIGEWMLIAPVFRKGQTEREIYLPAGDWVCWWTGKTYSGGQRIRVPAPMFEKCGLPVFIKAGAIIPRQEVTARLADEIPDPLTLDIYPAGTSRFVCHEAADVAHEFVCEAGRDSTRLELPNQTTTPREYILRLHGVAAPESVTLDGKALEVGRWHHDETDMVVVIHVPVAPGAVGTVVVQ